jgi:hypothetical protein
MKRFLIYASTLVILCAACVEAISTPTDVTDSSVPVTTTSIATAEDLATSSTVPTSTTVASQNKPSSTPSAVDDIDCDEAEELYDEGNNDDLADYCDYGPDGEWDTEDDYDGWEE